MHPNIELINRLYNSLAAHDPKSMAECYHQDATFEDIAFKLQGRVKIHGMWRFVTRPEPKAAGVAHEITHSGVIALPMSEREAHRVGTELTAAIKELLAAGGPKAERPVYTFLPRLLLPGLSALEEQAAAVATRRLPRQLNRTRPWKR